MVEAQMHYRSWQKDHTYGGFILVKRIGNINALRRRAPHAWPPSP
jgi:hypothetical protein